MTISILIADDDKRYRDGLRRLIEHEPGCRVVGEAGDGAQAVGLAGFLRPVMVLMDLAMPVLGGIDATRVIKQAWPEVRVIALSMHADPGLVEAMLGAGADCYVLKENAARDIRAAIRAA